MKMKQYTQKKARSFGFNFNILFAMYIYFIYFVYQQILSVFQLLTAIYNRTRISFYNILL